jgi:hypothetical protein
MKKALIICASIVGSIAFVAAAWAMYLHTGVSVTSKNAIPDLEALAALEQPTFDTDDADPSAFGITDNPVAADSAATPVSDNVHIQLPENLVVTGNIDLKCEGLPAVNGKTAESIVISIAREVSKCHKPHYSLADTSSPLATVRSYKKIVDEDDAAAQEGDSHDYEYWDLASIYSFLVSPAELEQLEKIAKQTGDDGSIANDILHAREIGSQPKKK